MADQKISGLTAVTSLNDTDVVYVLVDPSGTPLDRKITVSNLRKSMTNTLTDANGDFFLADSQWDDLRFPANGINPAGTAAPPTVDTTDGRLVFSASIENVVAIQVQMPHAWKAGSSIYGHVHWSPTNTDTGSVVWQLKYKVANIDEAFPGSWTTITVTDAADGTSDKHQMATFSAISMTNKTRSCMILMLLSRLGGDGSDTYNTTCKLNEFDLHYEIDKLGTDEET